MPDGAARGDRGSDRATDLFGALHGVYVWLPDQGESRGAAAHYDIDVIAEQLMPAP